MKSFKYSLIAALAFSAALCACSDDNDYAPGAPVEGNQVYFSDQLSSDVAIPENATSVTVDVNRVVSDDECTMKVASLVTDAEGTPVEGIFTVPSSVTFAKGEKVAHLVIGVDFAKVTPDKVYTIAFKLEGDNLTPYGSSEYTANFSYAPWTDWDYVSEEDAVYTITGLSSIKGSYKVTAVKRSSMVNPNVMQYGVAGLFTSGIDFIYDVDMDNTVEVDGKEFPRVTLQTFYSGLHNGGTEEEFIWMDIREWIAEFWGKGWENVDRIMELNDFGPSYFNTETGMFYIGVAVISTDCTPGTSEAYGVGYEYLQLPGYASYELDFSYSGNYVDSNGQEVAVVTGYKSDDVASYKCDVFPGKLGEDEVQAAVEVVKSNEDLPSIDTNPMYLTFALEEDGDYTVVGVGYDGNGEEVCTAAYSFEYGTVQGANPWESLGYCQYTDGNIVSLFKNLPVMTWDVEIQQNTETPGLYRLVNPYSSKFCPYTSEKEDMSGNYYLEIHAEKPDQVYLDQQCVGIDYGYGPIYLWSRAGAYIANGNPIDKVAEAGWCGTNVDGVITFPAGTLMTQFESDIEGGGFYYGNIDPKNPTYAEGYDGKRDPYWGEGTFCIDMSEIAAAPRKVNRPAAAAAQKTVVRKMFDEAQMFVNRANRTAVGKKMMNIDGKALQDYRKANPRQFKY